MNEMDKKKEDREENRMLHRIFNRENSPSSANLMSTSNQASDFWISRLPIIKCNSHVLRKTCTHLLMAALPHNAKYGKTTQTSTK